MVRPGFEQSQGRERELNLIASAPLWVAILFGCAMAAAAIEDVARFRISNITSLIVLLGAIGAAIVVGPTWALWENGAVFLAVLIIGFAAFAGGFLGGGDVKLFAAAALWFDIHSAVWFVAFVFMAGGVVAVLYLATRPFRKSAGGKKGTRIPYGLPIAVGALALALVDRGAFRHHERSLPPINIAPHQR
jgi:prepilin peptidase CpaA